LELVGGKKRGLAWSGVILESKGLMFFLSSSLRNFEGIFGISLKTFK